VLYHATVLDQCSQCSPISALVGPRHPFDDSSYNPSCLIRLLSNGGVSPVPQTLSTQDADLEREAGDESGNTGLKMLLDERSVDWKERTTSAPVRVSNQKVVPLARDGLDFVVVDETERKCDTRSDQYMTTLTLSKSWKVKRRETRKWVVEREVSDVRPLLGVSHGQVGERQAACRDQLQ